MVHLQLTSSSRRRSSRSCPKKQKGASGLSDYWHRYSASHINACTVSACSWLGTVPCLVSGPAPGPRPRLRLRLRQPLVWRSGLPGSEVSTAHRPSSSRIMEGMVDPVSPTPPHHEHLDRFDTAPARGPTWRRIAQLTFAI